MNNHPGMQILNWEEEGYQPLVFSHDWQVAILNWEPIFDLSKVGEIERHNLTDEVFVLVEGKAVLFTIDHRGEMLVEEMQQNVICNVLKSVWHNLLSTRDAKWIIVENRDTHRGDTEFRQLEDSELDYIKSKLPDWVR